MRSVAALSLTALALASGTCVAAKRDIHPTMFAAMDSVALLEACGDFKDAARTRMELYGVIARSPYDADHLIPQIDRKISTLRHLYDRSGRPALEICDAERKRAKPTLDDLSKFRLK